MDLIPLEGNSRTMIRLFLRNYLPDSKLDHKMQQNTLKMLQGKGKIFCETESHFTWSEFAHYVYSLMNHEGDMLNQTGIATAIELLLLATDIIDDLVDQDEK